MINLSVLHFRLYKWLMLNFKNKTEWLKLFKICLNTDNLSSLHPSIILENIPKWQVTTKISRKHSKQQGLLIASPSLAVFPAIRNMRKLRGYVNQLS